MLDILMHCTKALYYDDARTARRPGPIVVSLVLICLVLELLMSSVPVVRNSTEELCNPPTQLSNKTRRSETAQEMSAP